MNGMNEQRPGGTYLVTGCAGFIGSHVTEALLSQGCVVLGIDDFSTGKRGNLESALREAEAAFSPSGPAQEARTREAALRAVLPVRDRFRLIEGDAGDPGTLAGALPGVVAAIHLAAFVSVPRSVQDPVECHRRNATGFVNLLEGARSAGVRRIVYASSSAVYGDEPTLPKEEGMSLSPISPYGVTKAVDELYARSYSRLYGMTCVGLRFFNVFGPRQDPKGGYAAVIPKWIDSLSKGECPVCYGDGTQTRDFIFVRDVAAALIGACRAPSERVAGEVFNIGGGSPTGLLELYGAIRSALGKDDPAVAGIPLEFAPPREGDILHSWASVEKARRVLGFRAEHSLAEGLEFFRRG